MKAEAEVTMADCFMIVFICIFGFLSMVSLLSVAFISSSNLESRLTVSHSSVL